MVKFSKVLIAIPIISTMLQLSSILCILSISSLAYAQLIGLRIIDGEPTAIENFPYLISLQENGRPTCGGGIIGKHFILTAAHCVVDKEGKLYNSKFNVVAGTTDLKNSTNDLSVQVEKIYLLKSYRPIDFANDIAVLQLAKDLDLSRGLRILELPINDQDYVGQIAKVAGYGWIWVQDQTYGISDLILRYLNVTIISNDECRRQFSKFDHNIRQQIHDSNICGRALPHHDGNSAGVCKGDSGSPLVIGNTVIGVASRAGSTRCTEKALAARYTRVSSFVKFLNNVLYGVQSDDMKTYDLTIGDEAKYVIYFSKDKK